MSNSKSALHADHFLMSIEEDAGFVRVGEMIAKAAKERKKAGAGLQAIRSWLAGELVSDKALSTIERAQGGSCTQVIGEGVEGLDDFLAVANARAMRLLRAYPERFDYAEIVSRLSQGSKIVAELEDGFVEDVLIQTASRRRYDPAFNRRVEAELADVQRKSSSVERLTATIAHSDNNGGAGGDTPVAAAKARCTINGRPASCTLVVILIIVVIVVSKVNKANEKD